MQIWPPAYVVLFSALQSAVALASTAITSEQLTFFEAKIRPVLVAHCYECHSAEAQELEGGLQLDVKEGWQAGGDSGEPAIVPGKPDESRLIRAIRHEDGDSPMPPDQSKLPDRVIADLIEWVNLGAPDPREGLETLREQQTWETLYRERLRWWSLQPLSVVPPPPVQQRAWVRNEVDQFILAALEAKNVPPAAEADRRVLARRLSFALTGLPPTPELLDRFLANASADAEVAYVQSLLDSPHFGERWARHWMDVMHYADTHGYEWDVPAKNAWMYRDYLIRAFNADVPFRQLVLEHLAGDLIEPRVDAVTGLNESLHGPMALRLGERRHGDSAAAEGVTQEAMANIVDTVTKGFLATTVACAQCHDHKLDAVAQRDYFALAGVFMSSRWSSRGVDAVDPNERIIDELRCIKQDIRAELANIWLASNEFIVSHLQAISAGDAATTRFPEKLVAFWQRMQTEPIGSDEFNQECARRRAANEANLKLVADFTRAGAPAVWQWDGFGMRHGFVGDGEIVVAEEGDAALAQVLPAGRWSHVWSMRLPGALRSPLYDGTAATTFSIGCAGGRHAAYSMIVDQALHSERMQFIDQPSPVWLTLTAGEFDTLEGSVDRARRRVYLELATKSLNNYFPPRTGYGGVKETDLPDERSWFGVTQVYEHPPGKPPLDELSRFAPLFADEADWPTRFANLLQAAVERWSRDEYSSEDARLLDDALQANLLPNDVQATPRLAELVADYRATAKKLQPDRTIGSLADWHEGQDERIGIRGSYTEFGDEVPRGNISFLGGAAERRVPFSSGRWELALGIASDRNPLTARVFVNRVWLHLFGEGLVRTPDDFGHLGQTPSHPELLDYLADRFVAEGWSLKKLVTLLVNSATWRQSGIASAAAMEVDPENRIWHHIPVRRLEAEAIRDSILAVSGRLDPTLYGPPIDPYRLATDAAKRLYCGPLDGDGRRSIYLKMTLMEPPRMLAVFNQPIPKLTTGRRDVTNVPNQALALLNDPFVIEMARHWGEQVLQDGATSPEERAARMYSTALARPPQPEETARLVKLAEQSAKLRGLDASRLMDCQPAWQDAAHAIFNLKEFIYVP
ncbi:MAG: PSD1 and planctomycete cytochrome C domain-containing protein [Pirellulales bacterium]